jgi:hypothetical protein
MDEKKPSWWTALLAVRLSEGQQQGAAGAGLGELDGGLVGLRARLGEEGPRGPLDRDQPVQPLGELRLLLVVEVGAREVDEPLRLFLDGAHHPRVAVAGVDHADAGGEVEQDVAVHVLDHGAAGARGHDGGVLRGGDEEAVVARDDGLRPGARDGHGHPRPGLFAGDGEGGGGSHENPGSRPA